MVVREGVAVGINKDRPDGIGHPSDRSFKKSLPTIAVEHIHGLITVLGGVTANDLDYIQAHFPLKEARPAQLEAISFVDEHIEKGFNDIVIAAPTGSGKTAIGAAIAFWASHSTLIEGAAPGGYYLVTQKLLQDQIEKDFPKFKKAGASLKSATEYHCDDKNTSCALAGKGSNEEGARKSKCSAYNTPDCPYSMAKQAFMANSMSVTNYPYFFTEKTFVKKFKKRRVLIADECHTLESQITGFIEINIGPKETSFMRRSEVRLNELTSLELFREWIVNDYYERLEWYAQSMETASFGSEGNTKKFEEEAAWSMALLARLTGSLQSMRSDPDNWVYWTEKDDEGNWRAMAKPIDASLYFDSLIKEAAEVRIYLSAFPGDKKVFCRSLGLNPKHVAWLDMESDFPVDNRCIIPICVGSMSRRNVDESLPKVAESVYRIMRSNDEKGLLHCNSYKLGENLLQALKQKDPATASRIIFPKNAEERDAAFASHAISTNGSVLLSPSMTEGYDFKEDLAEWQIILKVPYPSLGDKQVVAKKAKDPDWYALKTVMTIVQACGRIVRTPSDVGYTYILDADFHQLLNRYEFLFPKWWMEALIFPEDLRK